MTQESKTLRGHINKLKEAARTHSRVSPSVLEPANDLIKSAEEYIDKTAFQFQQLLDTIQQLKEENEFLKNSVIEQLHQISNQNKPSFSEAVQKPVKVSTKTLLVKAKEGNNITPKELKQVLCNAISPINIKCSEIKINRTNLAYQFFSEKAMENFSNEIKNNPNLQNIITAYEPAPKCPNIILKNIDYSTPETDIIKLIIQQNEDLDIHESNLKVLFTIKKAHYYDAIICVSPNIFHNINNKIISVGWTASQAEETFLIGNCGKCLSFNHRTKDCTISGKKCKKCNGIFSTKPNGNQKSDFANHIHNCSQKKCFNCIESKQKEHNHEALSSECPIYNKRLSSIKNKICYDESKEVQFFQKQNISHSNMSPSTSAFNG
ncbi:hypothetical protein RDWZM_010173 [Blomia tropicalis]|uniref:Uncharacterized protein n=1 Tax=Blomia tropicalis TaxID=40697 RepID=A0A9Q0LW97_BLOTA|nr:hypothetical protein RDWZM_010173 [Blomia tropicalis]